MSIAFLAFPPTQITLSLPFMNFCYLWREHRLSTMNHLEKGSLFALKPLKLQNSIKWILLSSLSSFKTCNLGKYFIFYCIKFLQSYVVLHSIAHYPYIVYLIILTEVLEKYINVSWVAWHLNKCRSSRTIKWSNVCTSQYA